MAVAGMHPLKNKEDGLNTSSIQYLQGGSSVSTAVAFCALIFAQRKFYTFLNDNEGICSYCRGSVQMCYR
jgi:hypothetical protein